MSTPVKSDLTCTITFDASVTWDQAEAFIDQISELADAKDITMVARLDEEPVFENEVGNAE